MLRIRLRRTGSKNRPFYHIVVAEHSAPIKGKFLEKLGQYNSLVTPKVLTFDQQRIEHWLSVGAQPSQTVARLLAKKGVKAMEKYIEQRVMKPSKAELEAQKKKEEEAKAKAEAEKAAAEAKEAQAAEEASASEEKTADDSSEKETTESTDS